MTDCTSNKRLLEPAYKLIDGRKILGKIFSCIEVINSSYISESYRLLCPTEADYTKDIPILVFSELCDTSDSLHVIVCLYTWVII